MKKWLLAGTALLIIQIAAAVAVNLTDRDFGAFEPQMELLKFAPADIDGITIIGAGKELTIKRNNEEWLLADYFNARADNNLVTSLLEKLANLKQGLVIATSKGATKRFKVDEDDFERHILLRNGDTVLADFFLGTSPGFKKVHARVKDRQEVVSVPLNNYDLASEPGKWLDQKILGINEDDIIALTLGDIKLSKAGINWELTGLDADKEIDVDQVKKLLGKIANIRVKEILDKASSPLEESDPTLHFNITLKEGREQAYSFTQKEEKDYSTLKSSEYDYLFKVDNWQADEIGKFDKNTLIKRPAAEEKS